MSNVVCFGEVVLRLSAPSKARIEKASVFNTNYVGAEANVAANLSRLGHSAKFITALPENPLGAAARSTLMAEGAIVESITLHGSRLGAYYFENGAGARPSSILYDRKYSAFATCPPEKYNWRQILTGANWLHISGISLALGENARKATFDAIKFADEMGVAISFDCNFRASLWASRETEAPDVIREVVRYATLVFGGPKDAQLLFGALPVKASPGENFRHAAEKFLEFSPKITHVAATRRKIESADSNTLLGFIAEGNVVAATKPVQVSNIVDRIGAGDAFAAGVLYKRLGNAGLQETIDFAVAAAALKHTLQGDFLISSEAEINAFAAGAIDVQR